eukprot:4069244-Pyramimonas_sp.AAC.1
MEGGCLSKCGSRLSAAQFRLQTFHSNAKDERRLIFNVALAPRTSGLKSTAMQKWREADFQNVVPALACLAHSSY